MYSFNPDEVRDKLVAGIQKLSKEQGFHKVVIGISGGKDSTVTAALCVRALGKENVYGVMLPDGTQKDLADSQAVCNTLGIPNIEINIGAIHLALSEEVGKAKLYHARHMDFHGTREADINVPPRIRMTVLRYITQSLGARLAGTGNLSESTVGYCTKDGDTSCDFSVLGALTSVEVVQVGLTMGEIPKELVLKTPSDGLCGMSDEEKLGVRYRDIHSYIRGINVLSTETYQKITKMIINSDHKRVPPPIVYNPCDDMPPDEEE